MNIGHYFQKHLDIVVFYSYIIMLKNKSELKLLPQHFCFSLSNTFKYL